MVDKSIGIARATGPLAEDRPCAAALVHTLAGRVAIRSPARSEAVIAAGTSAVVPHGIVARLGFLDRDTDALIIEPDLTGAAALMPFSPLFGEYRHFRHPAIGLLARRISLELTASDNLGALAIRGLALDALVCAARHVVPRHHARRPPWMVHVEETLYQEFRRPVRLNALARRCGVRPAQLMRQFRVHYGVTIGEFVRALRIDLAASSLRNSTVPIAEVAIEAGFVDQSHFTRRFREQMGLTPGAWRRSWR